MIYSNLPNNCPPNDAQESDITLFRIFCGNNLDVKEFSPYVAMYPDRKDYKNKCEAYAVSFYMSGKSAYNAYKKALNKNKVLGSYIAKLKMPSKLGLGLNNIGEHYRIWFYDNINVNDIVCEEIIKTEDYENI